MATDPGMPATPKKKRGALHALPIVLVPLVFVASLPWLKMVGGATAVLIAAGVAGTFVVSYANYLSFLAQNRLDEVHKASLQFSAQWGVAVGQTAFVLLIALPPVLNFVTALVRDLAGEPRAAQHVIVLAMTLGFCGLVMLQAIASLVVRGIWWRARR